MPAGTTALPRRPRRRRALAGGLALLGALAVAPALSGPAAASTSTASPNLLVGDTAALARGTGSWVGTNALALTTKAWSGGLGSLVVTAKAAGTTTVQTGRTAVRAAPGSVFSGAFGLASAAKTGERITPFLAWYDAAGAEITGQRVLSAPTTDSSATWIRAIVSGIAPAGAAYVSLGASIPMARGSEKHYLASPALDVTAGSSPNLAGPLHTSGNTIYDATGTSVVLRGVNRSGTYNSAPDTLSQYDIDRIKAWGGNSVRITLAQHVWLPGCPTYDPAMPGIVDQAVKWITDAGMLAVLDLQWTAPTCSTGGLNPMPDSNSSVFWQQVASRYQANPLVAFDLFNEPHGVSDTVWADGGPTTTDSGVPYQAVGMRTLYGVVRGTGAQNLIFISGLGYASTWPSTAPLAGTSNVVYAVHAYNCDRPSTCTNGTGIGWMLDRFVTPGKTNPIMVTEFGWPAAGTREAQVFNTGVINFAEQHGWGWMPWAWPVNGNCRTSTYWDLIADGSCAVGNTYQPSPAGMPILNGLRRNA